MLKGATLLGLPVTVPYSKRFSLLASSILSSFSKGPPPTLVI
jgi:hypothetical protein